MTDGEDGLYPRVPGVTIPPPPQPRARWLAAVALAGLLGVLAGAALVARTVADDAAQVAPGPAVRAPQVVTAPAEQADRVAAVARAVLPSVVQLNVSGGGARSGNGSGVVYRSDGVIVTNNHVVADADSIEVVLADGTSLEGSIVGTDPETDLAVVRVERGGLPALRRGSAARLQVGELAVAVGSPFGLEGSVTAGVVSALDRPIPIQGSDGRQVTLPDVIQTDAPINPGNSGGALVSGDGLLIGINSAILTEGRVAANAGVGFAIPVETAVDVADELIATGTVRHPFLGVSGTDVDPDQATALDVARGAFVSGVQDGTPAQRAGLRHGDVIQAIAGQRVDTMAELIVAVRAADVGDTVAVRYVRDGRRQTARVTLVERPTPAR